MAGTSRSPVSGNRAGKPWTTLEKSVAVVLALLAIAFGAVCTVISSSHGRDNNLADLAMDLSWVGMVGCVIYLSVKRPELRRGFRVGRRR